MSTASGFFIVHGFIYGFTMYAYKPEDEPEMNEEHENVDVVFPIAPIVPVAFMEGPEKV